MAEYIKVQGVKDNICNCIDFYQGLTKVGLVGVKELRKSYLDMYLADYIQRCDETLKKRTKKKEEKKVADTPAINTSIKNSFGEEESGIDLFRNMLSTPDEVSYENHGVFIDENTVSEKEESTPVKSEVEYSSHGIFLGEVDIPTETVETPTDEVTDIEYENHGIYVEDIVTNISESEDEYEEDDEDYSEDDSEDEDEEDEDGYDYEDYDETDDSVDYVEEEKEEDDTEEDDEEYVSSKSLRENKVIDDFDDFEFLDYKEDTSTKDEVAEEFKVVPSVERVKPEVVKPVIRETVEKPKFQDYKNVRDFVKKNPGCSYSDVKEFFSMKEIQKALLNTKIVEKKNKLYVV